MILLNVVAAAPAAFALGALWYMALAEQWMQTAAIERDVSSRPKDGQSPTLFALSFALQLVVAGMMRHVFALSGIETLGAGLVAGAASACSSSPRGLPSTISMVVARTAERDRRRLCDAGLRGDGAGAGAILLRFAIKLKHFALNLNHLSLPEIEDFGRDRRCSTSQVKCRRRLERLSFSLNRIGIPNGVRLCFRIHTGEGGQHG